MKNDDSAERCRTRDNRPSSGRCRASCHPAPYELVMEHIGRAAQWSYETQNGHTWGTSGEDLGALEETVGDSVVSFSVRWRAQLLTVWRT